MTPLSTSSSCSVPSSPSASAPVGWTVGLGPGVGLAEIGGVFTTRRNGVGFGVGTGVGKLESKVMIAGGSGFVAGTSMLLNVVVVVVVDDDDDDDVDSVVVVSVAVTESGLSPVLKYVDDDTVSCDVPPELPRSALRLSTIRPLGASCGRLVTIFINRRRSGVASECVVVVAAACGVASVATMDEVGTEHAMTVAAATTRTTEANAAFLMVDNHKDAVSVVVV